MSIFVLPELLKKFETLEKLKLKSLGDNPDFDTLNISDISKVATLSLKKLRSLHISNVNIDIKKMKNTFFHLKTHEALRKFKLENCKIQYNDCTLNNEFGNFVAKSKLISLTLSNVYKFFTCETILNFAEALIENNNQN